MIHFGILELFGQRIILISLRPVFGIGFSFSTITSFNYGAERLRRVKKVLKEANVMRLVMSKQRFRLLTDKYIYWYPVFTETLDGYMETYDKSVIFEYCTEFKIKTTRPVEEMETFYAFLLSRQMEEV